MPRGEAKRGGVLEWLNSAKGDLAFARQPLPEGCVLESLCFHAQQAAEKAIKAIYRHYGWPVAYTHNLEHLLDGLEMRGVDVSLAIREAGFLTDYAVSGRYPWELEDQVDQAEYRLALRRAEAVVAWAESIVMPDH